MARIIVNEGAGPRSIELLGMVTVGSNPSCDVVLEHPSALGVRVELKPLRFGYRVKLIKGELKLNDSSCEMADLDHNDALQIGEVMLLYKQPEGAGFEPVTTPSEVTPEGLELLDDLEELPELEIVEELDELEELEELQLEELEPERVRGVVEEIDLRPEAPDDTRAAPAQPDPGLEEALLRARWKRLEMLRRLKRAQQGELESYPDLRDPGALSAVQQLDLEGRTESLEKFEVEQQLEEASLPELAERVEAARAAGLQQVEDAAAKAAAERAAAEAAQAEEALEELEELPLDELEELPLEEELEELPELELTEAAPAAALGAAAASASPRDTAPRAPQPSAPAPARDLAPAASAAPPAGVRPLPPEGIRWERPLPPGRRGPTFLPPVHPGAPQR
ncbi:MAG: hypothetical protein DHS20C15_16130 [Planctomycetota bacterium]|nr:MAG: hypothetical protein DHS20C15_16130 [Planctomycetota bacterium]